MPFKTPLALDTAPRRWKRLAASSINFFAASHAVKFAFGPQCSLGTSNPRFAFLLGSLLGQI
ncbi:hypothetical protein OIN70_14845, partial [Staphylococcus aureus]